MNHRRFARVFLLVTGLFVLVNALVWMFFTRDILTRSGDIITGDLARIGYISDLRHVRRNTVDLSRTHMESGDYDGGPVDLLTVGDSFSQGASGGPNRYYQDFIATHLGWRVLNLQRHPDAVNDLEFIAMLANGGFLEQAGVRYVLLEATQRRAVTRLIANADLERSISQAEIDAHYRFGEHETGGFDFSLPALPFINTGNFKFLAYSLLYRLDDCALFSVTCRVTLDNPLFTVGNGHEMLFYKKDIRSIKHNNSGNVALMNDRLNALAALLDEMGVRLIFMPAVSKYDLYREYFVGTDHPHDPFFPNLRKLQHAYHLLDTKAVFSAVLNMGEKDLFYVDDTHWGPAASRLVAYSLDRLKTQQ